MNKIVAIILAGGKGERMKSEIPKVLHQLQNKPLIQHVIDNLKKANIDNLTVVIGYKGEEVIKTINPNIKHVWQHEQLGTGHAVMQTNDALSGYNGKVIVACGDVPLIKPETFLSLIQESKMKNVKAVVLTMEVDNPSGYGRIIKDKNGKFVRIVEEKDSTENEKTIKEVNTGTYIFDKDYLFKGLGQVDQNNAQGEYYLPDALNYVINSGYTVGTLLLQYPVEGSGINSKEDLANIENYMAQMA